MSCSQPGETELISCLFCDLSYAFPAAKDDYLGHLFLSHRLIIADVEEIKLLPDYLKYWKELFTGHLIAEYCTTMLLDKTPEGVESPNEKYYLLSDIVPQDFEIRKKLKSKYLEIVLTRHQFEKNDETFERGCLHCRDVIKPTRSSFLEHLYSKHFLHLGKPENLVFIDELLDVVEKKLEDLVCLYCERVFKDRPTLKEHMRKKGHKRINPENKFYDKFFLVNYKMEGNCTNRNEPKPGSSGHQRNERKTNHGAEKKPKTKPREQSTVFQIDNSDSDWSEWEANADEATTIMCLFCKENSHKIDELKKHMKETHNYDFDQIVQPLNFYQRVKLINYIRRQIMMKRCINNCDLEFENEENLLKHMTKEQHFLIQDKNLYNQPQYFFPTVDDDAFLCYLEDTLSEELERGDDDSAIVVTEDSNVSLNLHVENYVMENLVNSGDF